MKRFLPLILICAQACGPAPESDPPQNQPNIIYILADDLGYGDITALNPDSDMATPHLDRFVGEGMYFSDAHSNSAVCTPTRYGILTGRYAWRTPLKSGVLWGYSPLLINEDRPTVASFLAQQGYRTGVVGKWHLGLGWQSVHPDSTIVPYDWQMLYDSTRGSNVDFSQPVTNGPNSVGFEYSFVFPSSLDMTPYVYVENHQIVGMPNAFTPGKSEAVDGRGVFWRAGEIAEDMQIENVLDDLKSKAIGFIEAGAKEERPFFLYFPLTAPHAPWVPTSTFAGTSKVGTYGDFVQQVDQVVGDILAALKAQNIDDETIVFFSSDNGAHWTSTDQEEFPHRSNYIFRGQKADIYEGGHRVPMAVRWPEHIAPGTYSEHLFSTTDFFATVAGILDTEPLAGSAEDSYDQSPILFQESAEPIREVMIQHSLNGSFAIRDGHWKYTPQLGSGGFTDPSTREPLPGEAPGTLFHLGEDPKEELNVYKAYPNQVERLHKKLEQATGLEF